MWIRTLPSRVKHPLRTTLQLVSRTRPDVLWERYSKLCARQGFTQPAFVLSMDCDTTEDIQVVGEVHTRLADMRIVPVYAVPGELLEAGAETYQRIAASGGSFMNHGHSRHTSFDPSTRAYTSYFFYDRLSPDQLQRDIVDGHEAVTRVVGRAPTGFRTPHFGSFQKKSELARLHTLLRDLGYRYSTSTMPIRAFTRGPVIQGEVLELPITGCRDDPLTVLDSWSFRFDKSKGRNTRDYEEQARGLAEMLKTGRPCFINLYVDPSQVHDWDGFFEAMERFAPYACTSYDDVLDRLRS